MQKGQVLHIPCEKCHEEIHFSIFDLKNGPLHCPHCGAEYRFEDSKLLRQIEKFEKLCLQLIECEEILGDTCVGIDFDGRSVKIPYKILLTRIGSTLDLEMNGKPVSVEFRLEPIEEMQKILKSERTCDTVDSKESVTIPVEF